MAFALALMPLPSAAQDLGGLARVDPAGSVIEDAGRGFAMTLYLSQAVPYRVFSLDDPARFILDFREADWRGVTQSLDQADSVTRVQFGPVQPGWSRLVVELAEPMALTEAGLRVNEVDGTAVLLVQAEPVSAETFAAQAGAPEAAHWALDQQGAVSPVPEGEDAPLVIVIDAGHGGIDPGAERDGLTEADLTLHVARDLAEAVDRAEGMRAVLVRDADVFVPLDARISRARSAGADVFLSLHADALEGEQATGLSIYTLSDQAVDSASQRMAERHEAGDLLLGLDLSGADDRVAAVLMDLARLETGPASERLADTLVIALSDAGVVMNSRPRREGQFAVLGAPDFPSVLIELGFLSNVEDRKRLLDTEARALLVEGLVQGLARWQTAEIIRAPLIRQ